MDEGAALPMRASVTVVPKPGKWTLAAFPGSGDGGVLIHSSAGVPIPS